MKIGKTFDEYLELACSKGEEEPIVRLVAGGSVWDLELEIAFRIAQIDAVSDTPSLQRVHSWVIVTSLNMVPGRKITPYSNMKQLQERLLEAGFRIEKGQVVYHG